MGLMKRREFLAGGLLSGAARRQSEIEIEVMEVFSSSSGPSALLVHHADEATREAFANWLRRNTGTEIVLQQRDKTPIDAWVFRVSRCFGRGLVLLRTPLTGIRAKDVLRLRHRGLQ
jgi:hypothetical protein